MPPSPTRQHLVDAAIALARRQGLAGAGINEIVRESGAPKGSVHWFFPEGKQQIVTEALDAHAERVLAFIDAAKRGRRNAGARIKLASREPPGATGRARPARLAP